eukprot:Blabericola_migrator_1__5560@NODE_2831_length_2302_cov_83_896197_g1776_i0_p1_GENE_NODE_2831_length_2302_cov_83_896197_g1776_i0NODE_2831_length_2302_cov_83_896197_g1776_i0_p1_ORF_typecomplete_len202_score30_10DDR/PF08841_10/3_1e03DDR/PF08841_10/0_15_NODE_2831_length_2302_cov_83_896197_g1776_i014362041
MLLLIMMFMSFVHGTFIVLDLADSKTENCSSICDVVLSGNEAMLSELTTCLMLSPPLCQVAYRATGAYSIEETCQGGVLLTLYPTTLPETAYTLTVTAGVPDPCVVQVIQSTDCNTTTTGTEVDIGAGSSDLFMATRANIVLRGTTDCVTQLTTASLAVKLRAVNSGQLITEEEPCPDIESYAVSARGGLIGAAALLLLFI